ncbi:MAG: restriction endonuclease subunit S [Bellilinea sp.]
MMQLNSLPNGWNIKPLEECVEILDSRRIPINADEREKRIANTSEAQLFPYFGATGQVGWIDDFIFNDEILLLGEDGAPFLDNGKDKAYLVQGKSWVNNHAHVLKAINGITSNMFLMHYLNFFDYHDYVTGTTRLKLNQAQMRRFPILLPPVDEQERITSKIEELFTQLDAGMAALKRVQAGLKRYKASVLKAAVDGKLVPQDPSDEPAAEMLRKIGKKPMEGEGLAPLPEGWCWVTVDDLAKSIQYGYTESASDEQIGPKFLRITDIQHGLVEWEIVPYCKIDDEQAEKYLLRKGDIVFARTGATTGKSYLINECPKSVFASYLIRLRLHDSLDVDYFSLFLDSPLYWSQIMIVRKGSAQPGVNATILATLKVPYPPLDEQRRIVSEVERRLSVAKENEAVIETTLVRAVCLRQAILKQAFEGRLDND